MYKILVGLAVISIIGCFYNILYQPNDNLFSPNKSISEHLRKVSISNTSNIIPLDDLIIGMAQHTDIRSLSIFCDSLRL